MAGSTNGMVQRVVDRLLVAVLFSWSVSFLMLATFVWPEWISGWLRASAWGALVLAWLVGAVRNHWWMSTLSRPEEDAGDQLAAAQDEYLRGNWFEAEAILLEMLDQNSRDVPAGLLMVGVMRRTQRLRNANMRLEQLRLLDDGRAWGYEIQAEMRLVEAAIQQSSESPPAEPEPDEGELPPTPAAA